MSGKAGSDFHRHAPAAFRPRIRHRVHTLTPTWILVCVAACATVPGGPTAPGTPGAPASSSETSEGVPMPPAGFGRMTLDQISLTIDSAGIQLKITPLSERVLRATAADTYAQLHALQAQVVTESADPERTEGLFLVSIYVRAAGRAFTPEALRAGAGSQQLRAERIVPLTAGWANQRVGGGLSESAIYIFDRRMELSRDLTFAYGDARSRRWSTLQTMVESELVRARARAGGGDHYAPSARR